MSIDMMPDSFTDYMIERGLPRPRNQGAVPFNGLTPAEAERLAMLAEECGEVVQAVTKILRHGFDSNHPNDQHQVSNRETLRAELTDVLGVLAIMQATKDAPLASREDIQFAAHRKLRHAHHQVPA